MDEESIRRNQGPPAPAPSPDAGAEPAADGRERLRRLLADAPGALEAVERELQRRVEEQLRLALDGAEAGTWDWDLRTDRMTWSDAVWGLHGLARQEGDASYQAWCEAIHPEDRARMERGIEEARSGGALELEWRIARGDGPPRWLRARGRPIRDASGAVVRLAGVVLDVTDRKRAEQALHESEHRYRLLAGRTHDVIWTLDLATLRFTYVSPSVWALRGLTVEEALAEPFERSLTSESMARVQAAMARVGTPEERDPITDVYDQPCKDGRIKHVEITTALVRDAEGRPREVIGVSRDATERVRAQRALAESEERFRALIEKSTDLILVLDADGRCQFWSQGAADVLGWTGAEMQGRNPVRELVPPEELERVAGRLEWLLAHPGQTVTELHRALHRDGSFRWIQSTARNLLDEPPVMGVVVNARDVTAQRLLEDQLRQAQKLESVGRLAGGVAHDFNNLLTVIQGCAAALEEAVAAGAPVDPGDLRDIRTAADRAGDLTRRLLAFARKQRVAAVPLDLGAVVRGSEPMLRRLLGEDIDLRVAIGPDLWTVAADPGQLEQIVVNLAVNARDAMPRGGTLLLEAVNAPESAAAAAAFPDRPPGDGVQLRVADSGTGMSPEVQAHVFEPFFTTKPPGKGTGLGLATVYGIVKQAGGHIHFRSEPGRGTRFEVWLPRVAAGPAPAQPAGPPSALGGTERLLVVEDDAQVRTVTVRALRAAGYQVLEAAHPREALALPADALRGLRLLVTDVVMPELDGRQLAQELCARHPSLRVLYVSGYTPDSIAERGLLDPGVAFLGKPFTGPALLERVRAALDAP